MVFANVNVMRKEIEPTGTESLGERQLSYIIQRHQNNLWLTLAVAQKDRQRQKRRTERRNYEEVFHLVASNNVFAIYPFVPLTLN